MMVIRKASFTLVEFIVVIMILSVISGVIGVNIRKLLTEERFNVEAGQVLDTLRLAQDLMLLLNTDVHVKFADAKENTGIKYGIELEKKLAPSWMKQIEKSHRILKAIHLLEFDDRLDAIAGRRDIDIRFLSGGSVMSGGVLHMASIDKPQEGVSNVQHRYICLPGYPAQITMSTEKNSGSDCSAEAGLLEQVTSATQGEIAEKQQQQPPPPTK